MQTIGHPGGRLAEKHARRHHVHDRPRRGCRPRVAKREWDKVRGGRERYHCRRRAAPVHQADPAEGDEEERRVAEPVVAARDVVERDQRERGRQQHQRRRPGPAVPRQHTDDDGGGQRDDADRERRAAVRRRDRGNEGPGDDEQHARERIEHGGQLAAEPARGGGLHRISSDGPPPGFIPPSEPLRQGGGGAGAEARPEAHRGDRA